MIDNPSAKFSPEGSAGIINIILKRDRKAGYYGSLRAGANNNGGWNTGGNFNYSSGVLDAFANLGYRRRAGNGGSESQQEYLMTREYQDAAGESDNKGGNLFARLGLNWHVTQKDEISLSGMTMQGKNDNESRTNYDYGVIGQAANKHMYRLNTGEGDMHMYHGEIGYEHKWNDFHKLKANFGYSRWMSDNDNIYRDDTYDEPGELERMPLHTYYYQFRPMHMRNRSMEAKLDYENKISEKLKIEAGYNGRFSHEDTPQQSFEYSGMGNIGRLSTDDPRLAEDPYFYNRFVYDNDIHALYATANMKFGRLGVMAGLRGEYWKVDTRSTDYYQVETPFKKDYFQLFPSLFLNYAITETSQVQLNYTRRLRRPWGGQLNSFKNTRDASMIDFGNPELTPEYTNWFSLNFLKTWPEHTLSLGTYYRPTTDVMQRIRYQGEYNGQATMFMTNLNVAKSQSAGAELILKDKLWRILDLTTTLNAYYYKLDGFETIVEKQLVTGEGQENFAWTGRLLASIILPYDISIQATGNYNSRQVITQGYRKANGSLDLGLRKTFLNKMFALAINWRDVFDSRSWENYTEGPTFWRHQKNHRDPRLNVQLTWNFGNMMPKKKPQRDEDGQGNEEDSQGGYGGFEQ